VFLPSCWPLPADPTEPAAVGSWLVVVEVVAEAVVPAVVAFEVGVT